jgi:hypothetical protein
MFMDFQGLKVVDFLLNREGKRTRARVPEHAGCDVKPGTHNYSKFENTVFYIVRGKLK